MIRGSFWKAARKRACRWTSKNSLIRSANDSRASGEQTGSDSESVKFDSLDPSRLTLRADLWSLHLAPAPALDCDISGKKSSSALDSRPSPLDSTHGLRAGEFFAVKDVSFELRRGECLGLIGHNGAGKTTLLKMLNGLIKPDAGSITMRGRVGALIALGAGFNPSREPKGWEARRTSNRRLAQRVQRRKEGANQNIFLNGAILGVWKPEPRRWARRDRLPQAGPQGFAIREERKPNFDRRRGLGGRPPSRRVLCLGEAMRNSQKNA